jgi:hypothetical protein
MVVLTVAAIFGEEHWDRRVLEHGGQIIVAGRVERVDVAAPRVRVEAEEVAARGVGVRVAVDGALEVLPGVFENVANIGGRVADGERSVAIGLDVLLQIALDCLVTRSVSPIPRVNDYFTRM